MRTLALYAVLAATGSACSASSESATAPAASGAGVAAVSAAETVEFVTVSADELARAVELAAVAGQPPLTSSERRDVEALYAPGAAVWLDDHGRAGDDAREALALLTSASEHGLDPGDYQAAALVQRAVALEDPETPSDLRAAFDIDLSRQLLRYWRALHMGRVDPRAVGFRMDGPVDDHDFPAMLRDALARRRLRAATDDLPPALSLYRGLVQALARYRELAVTTTPFTLTIPGRSVKPGERLDGVAELWTRLEALGDRPSDGSLPPLDGVYDGSVVDGVKRFQRRHGLEVDGVLGRATVAALNVPLAARVQQLEMALERLRWLPHPDPRGFLAVNIPMFHVWGWDHPADASPPAFGMAVIVGRALNTETPVFVAQMRHVIFRPYWNIPPSILRGEVLPALAKDPTYLRRQDMEIVDGPGDDARVVPMSEETAARLRDGRLRVRQRPGAKNSLGLVKFVFPNDDHVYMHGTPTPYLFSRARRDFSHGCVRVADPVRLAQWVLRDQPEWTRDRIVQAMQGKAPLQVELTHEIPVVLFYLTAEVMPEDGAVSFADDLYGHDARLARALARR